MFPTWIRPSELGRTPLLTHYCRGKVLQLLQSKPSVTAMGGIFLLRGVRWFSSHLSCHSVLKFHFLKFLVLFSRIQFRINGRLTRTPVSSPCFKDHSLNLLAGGSANIAALLFLLVSIHTSPTPTTSLPDMESGEWQVRPPMTRTRSDTPYNPSYPTPSLYWNKLAPSDSLSSLGCTAVSEAVEGEEQELGKSQNNRESTV